MPCVTTGIFTHGENGDILKHCSAGNVEKELMSEDIGELLIMMIVEVLRENSRTVHWELQKLPATKRWIRLSVMMYVGNVVRSFKQVFSTQIVITWNCRIICATI